MNMMKVIAVPMHPEGRKFVAICGCDRRALAGLGAVILAWSGANYLVLLFFS